MGNLSSQNVPPAIVSALLCRAQSGNCRLRESAEERLLALYDSGIRGIANAYARNFRLGVMDKDDVLQLARVGFVKALRRYDPGKGANLLTFAYIHIRAEIRRALVSEPQSRLGKYQSSPSLVEYLDDLEHGTMDPSSISLDLSQGVEVRLGVAGFIGSVSAPLRKTAECLFWRNMTQADAARVLGVSRAAVSQNLRRLCRLGRDQLEDFA